MSPFSPQVLGGQLAPGYKNDRPAPHHLEPVFIALSTAIIRHVQRTMATMPRRNNSSQEL